MGREPVSSHFIFRKIAKKTTIIMREEMMSSFYIFFNIRKDKMTRCGRSYGFLNFAFDIFMTVITCGFWLIWIFVREMRNR